MRFTPKSPKGWLKHAISLFVPVKFNFSQKSLLQSFFVLKLSAAYCSYIIPYPTVHRSIAGDVPIYPKLAFKVMHPFRKRRFPKFSFSCASTMKASTDTFCDRNLAQRMCAISSLKSSRSLSHLVMSSCWDIARKTYRQTEVKTLAPTTSIGLGNN